MNAIVEFDGTGLPAEFAKMFEVTNDLAAGRAGFPVLSIKGKVFHVKRGDESLLVTRQDPDTGEKVPAASLSVVILKAYPEAGRTAKTYYAKSYVEGSDEPPLCSSNDGISPEPGVPEPQCATCAACPHNVWGSKISDDGKKGRACADTKRLAIAHPSRIDDPMLLRVPPASFKNLTALNELLSKRKVPYQAVIVRMGFDHNVAHPLLTFTPTGFIDTPTAKQVLEVKDSPIVAQITGSDGAPKTAPAQIAAPVKEVVLEDPVTPPPAETKPPAAKTTKATAKATPAAVKATPAAAQGAQVTSTPKVVEASEGIASALDSISFDD